MKLLVLGLIFLGVIGCDQKGSMDSAKERATAEEQAGRDVENNNLAQKAKKMENDLNQRHKFYAAIEGEYTGSLNVDGENFNIKFNFVRSLPPYSGERIRELSEIENEINNLYFHIQVVQWHPEDPGSAVGCRVSGGRPNMDSGMFTIASPDCPNLYTVLLSEDGVFDRRNSQESAKNLAQKLKSQAIQKIDNLVGSVQPSSNATKYLFAVKRFE